LGRTLKICDDIVLLGAKSQQLGGWLIYDPRFQVVFASLNEAPMLPLPFLSNLPVNKINGRRFVATRLIS
jgi:hypothetical protein